MHICAHQTLKVQGVLQCQFGTRKPYGTVFPIFFSNIAVGMSQNGGIRANWDIKIDASDIDFLSQI